ncbi:MAG: hypothetical protein AB1449_04690 [Chloroflexota bacterium]
MRKPAVIFAAVGVVLVVAGGSFYGGIAFGRTRQANVQAQFLAERGFPQGGEFGSGPVPFATPAAPGQAGGRGANGTIKSFDGNTVLLSTAQDVTTVLLDSDTIILRQVAGTREDLQPGVRITVLGERDENEAVRATTIQILSEGQP